MKLATYSKGTYNSAMDALNSGAIYQLRELNDIDSNTTLGQLNDGSDMRNADVWMHIQTAENALEATGSRDEYVFILMDDKLPCFELVDNTWVDISPTNFLMKHMIARELDQIEKWSGEAYCGPNMNGAGPEGDEIYQALYNIRKIIGIGVKKYNR